MNKSLLLIICDFLVLSLIAFVRFDDEDLTPADAVSMSALKEAEKQNKSEINLLIDVLNEKTERLKSEKDEISEDLKSEMEEIQKKLEAERKKMQEELEAKQKELQAELAKKEKELKDREEELKKTGQDLELTTEEKERLAKQAAQLEEAIQLVEKQKVDLQKERSQLREERAELSGKLTAQFKEAAAARAELIHQVNQLSDQKQDLALQKGAISERLKNMQNEVERSRAELQGQKLQLANLDKTRQTLEKTLAQKEANLASARNELTKTESAFASAQTNIKELQAQRAALEGKVVRTEAEKAIVAQKAEALEAETQKLQNEAEVLLATRRKLEKDKENLLEQKSSLQTELTTAQLSIESARKEEQRINARITEVKQQLSKEEEENKKLQEANEKMRATTEKLADEIADQTKVIAEKTENINQRIEEAQPLSPNQIYTTFRENQIKLKFVAKLQGILRSTRVDEFTVPATLVQDETGVYAVCLANETPFELDRFSSVLEVNGEATASGAKSPLSRVHFFSADPRILMIPVDERIAQGKQPFRLDPKPNRFPKAIVIDPNAQSFGELALQIYPKSEQYFEFKGGLFRSLNGDFTSGTADYAFSQAGYLLGVLVNRKHAIHIPSLDISSKIDLGDKFNSVYSENLIKQVLRPKVRTIEQDLY